MLVIPPGCKITERSKNPLDRIQVKCVDSKGRPQYIYHPLWVALTAQLKFKRFCRFSGVIKKISRSASTDPLDSLIKLMLSTNIRVGSDKYAEDNSSFGVCTLLNKHVKDRGTHVELKFKGKSGKEHQVKVSREPHLSFIRSKVSEAKKTSTKRLFPSGTAERVRARFKKMMGKDYNPKDLRTYNANSILYRELKKEPGEKPKKELLAAINRTSEFLHHTPSVCRSNYLSPEFMELWTKNPKKVHSSSFGEIIKNINS